MVTEKELLLQKKNRIISAGRLEYEKGYDLLLEYSFNTRRLASIEL